MKEYRSEVAGELVTVNVVETADDLERFRDFVRGNLRCLAVDSEATGLNMYAPGFKLRLVQFGNPREAYVVPVERGGQFAEDVRRALRGLQKLVFQNGGFDLQVFDQHLDVKMEELWPKTLDTRILAHLVDPRGQEEGGIGHGLEQLTAHYLDRGVALNVKGLMGRIAKEYKTTKANVWSLVDIDHPDYNLYAGMDPILAARLASKLTPLVPASSKNLISFEHELAEVCSYMERTGFLLDVEYTQALSERLYSNEEYWTELARDKFGIESVNSTEQVADALEEARVRITERTATGKRKVDKALLEALKQDPSNPRAAAIAEAVTEAKQTHKWRTTWVDTFLDNRDSQDRCHPNINPLRARTARMSITGIPAQTLPSGDWVIRRCFLADEGHRPAGIDYQAQELRVLAALSGDRTMIRAFAEGADLHLITAQTAFGDHITKEDKERKYGKTANFQKVYGGGAKSLAKALGIPLEVAKMIHEGFDKAYPGVTRLSRKLQAEGRQKGYITTPTGRRLPVDPDRAYSALNYLVQSTSRDVTARGLIRLHKAGFTPYLRLPIHDEVIASLPAEHAEWGANRIAQLMAEQMGPVHIGTDTDIGIRSWGSLSDYGASY